jgi:hypothetical protein
MPERDFLIYLDKDTRLCRYRHHHVTNGKRVIEFCVQLETIVNEAWYVVIRYDTSYGRPHQDILRPSGRQTKKWLNHLSTEEALTFGRNDIMENWKVYRERFLKEFRNE